MQLPFTATQFVGVFSAYNAAVWPTQIVAYALGALVLYLATRSGRLGGVTVAAVLSAMWAFTGIGYHLLSFSAINPAARLFAVAFVAEAVLLLVAGVRGTLTFGRSLDVRAKAGLGLAAFAMVVYPALGFMLGHGFPNGPAFGITPCPLAIFTFGVLLMADRAPRYLGVIPVLWAAIGTSAAFALGIREDIGLALSALTWIALGLRRPAVSAHPSREAIASA